MYRRRALIIGIAGQDGSLLAELLLAEGYDVFGVVRQPVSGRFDNLTAIRDRVELLQADVLSELSLVDVITSCRPHEVYNLASPSFVPMSWRQPVLTAEFAAVGCTALLEAIRRVDTEIRFYQASSSEIFGEPREVPQTEVTPLAPVTPYGVAKAYAHFITLSYRRRYGLHASSGILYNHESSRRPLDFVTRKISRAAAAISLGLEHEVALGDLDSRRDWGYAGDYVRAMWLMLQRDAPADYVIATGESNSVRDLVELAFAYVDLDWTKHVRTDESLVRGKAELHHLVGDARKAREELGWSPTVDFEELVHMLVDADLERLRSQLEPAENVLER
ncbi:MAG TPA: GDP-mannose 4,6-dehydratase [Gaiella sp.]